MNDIQIAATLVEDLKAAGFDFGECSKVEIVVDGSRGVVVYISGFGAERSIQKVVHRADDSEISASDFYLHILKGVQMPLIVHATKLVITIKANEIVKANVEFCLPQGSLNFLKDYKLK